MLLSINHITKYNYDEHLKGVIQSTKLIPSPYNGLKIKKWEVTKNNQKGGEVFRDAEGNNIVNFRSDHTEQNVSFHVVGEVETVDTNGLFESLNDKIDPLVYLRNTSLTIPNEAIIELAQEAVTKAKNSDYIEIAHNILMLIAEKVKYVPYTTNTQTTAAVAIDQEKGVCQDQAHIMISAARSLNIPARYVSGYMHKNQNDSEFQATHAWAELFIKDLGWIGFDPTNKCCPDERYIRVSCGLDASYAAPIRGVFYGETKEDLDISVQTLESSAQ